MTDQPRTASAMTRTEAGHCPTGGEHDWIEVTTLTERDQRFLCVRCNAEALESRTIPEPATAKAAKA